MRNDLAIIMSCHVQLLFASGVAIFGRSTSKITRVSPFRSMFFLRKQGVFSWKTLRDLGRNLGVKAIFAGKTTMSLGF